MLLFFTLLETQEDREKFNFIYNEYCSFVTKIVAHKIQDPYKVEEVVQLVFIRIAKSIGTIEIDKTKRLKSYIYTIASNCCIDEINKTSSEPIIYSLDLLTDIVPADEDFEGVLARDVVEKMMKYILRMSPIYKHVLLLYFVNENSVKQIAWCLDIPEKTVRTRLSRGIKQLVDKAKEIGYE